MEEKIYNMTSEELIDNLKQTQQNFESATQKFPEDNNTSWSHSISLQVRYKAKIDAIIYELESRNNKEIMENNKKMMEIANKNAQSTKRASWVAALALVVPLLLEFIKWIK